MAKTTEHIGYLRQGNLIYVDDNLCDCLYLEDESAIYEATKEAIPGASDYFFIYKYVIKNKKIYIKEMSCTSMYKEARRFMNENGYMEVQDRKKGSPDELFVIDKPISFTGKMIVADERIRDFSLTGLVFHPGYIDYSQPWWRYQSFCEYTFDAGNVVEEKKDLKHFVQSFRREILFDNHFETRMAIDPRFICHIKERGYDKKYWWLKKVVESKSKEHLELYLPYMDKYHGFFYALYVPEKSEDDLIGRILNECGYISTIEQDPVVISEEGLRNKLNCSSKQAVMYAFLSHTRGTKNGKDVMIAMELINRLY